MAKLFYFDKVTENGKFYIFRTDVYNEFLLITSFKDGVAVAEPMLGDNIISFSEMIANCFDENSNFKSELFRAFGCDKEAKLIQIKFKFNEGKVIVTKENADKDKILDEWKAECNRIREKQRIEFEEYRKTPEYRAKRAKELKSEARKAKVAQKVLEIDESTELEFKDDEARQEWQEIVNINSNKEYGECVVTYARRWAKFMQYLMNNHDKRVTEVASNASFASDIDGITGFMYGVAVGILSDYWKYGEELRKWHNKQYGVDETENGVVTPALINCYFN